MSESEKYQCPTCPAILPLHREGYIQRHDPCGVRWPLDKKPSSVHAIPTVPPGSGKKRK